MSDNQKKIRITSDEVDRIILEHPAVFPPPPPRIKENAGPRDWGRIDSTGSYAARSPATGTTNVFFKAWVYLGVAGLVGAFIAWALCEPSFNDRGPSGFGNIFMFPAFGVLVSVAFVIAESMVERSRKKAVGRAALAVVLGVILSFVFYFVANGIYHIGLRFLYDEGTRWTADNPLYWIVRAIAWSVFGVTGGVVYGITGQSAKKCGYGVMGGMIGAAVGGLVFDPVCMLTAGGAASRCLGLMVMGGSTGAAIGLVESALKDRWLYVSGGPLAGKQFILYKPQTHIGGDQANEIYLFKDTSIQPLHAVIELHAGRAVLTARGSTFISGQPVTERSLKNGDLIQIGRYTFNYQEKQKHSNA
jgi:Inner membrane component of T3SS, cytoplasmic domain